MTTNTEPPISQPEVIQFPNGRRAEVLVVPPTAEAAAILERLALPAPERLIILSGSAAGMNPRCRDRVRELLSRGMARAAADVPNTFILDGGTKAGVMELMGQGVADRDHKSLLLGVTPANKVSYPDHPATDTADSAELDPNHSHFVLVESDRWGGETDLMFHVADALVKQDAWAHTLVVTLVVQGNSYGISVQEVLATVRRGWPLIVIESQGWWEKLATRVPRRQDANTLEAPAKERETGATSVDGHAKPNETIVAFVGQETGEGKEPAPVASAGAGQSETFGPIVQRTIDLKS